MARTTKSDIAAEYIEKFPNTSNMGLSRILCKEVPAMFDSESKARKIIQYVKGTAGKKQLKARGKKIHKRILSKCKGFEAMPEGIKEIPDWEIKSLRLKKTLCLSDVHIPYHDKKSLILALEYGKNAGCEDILILGDFIDFHAVSSFQDNPRERDFQLELETYYQVMDVIRSHFKGRIIYKLGNHEDRYERYFILKAPELLGVEIFSISELLRFNNYKIEAIKDKRPIKINNNLTALHGHEFSRSVFSPVNPARGLFLRTKATTLCGHYHQTSEHSETNINGKVITCWSIGCLCDLHPKYMPNNKWNIGFAVIDTTENDMFMVENKKIIDGMVV